MKEESNYSRWNLKRRLIKEGLLENKCEVCNQPPMWNGATLVLVLDHKNGKNNDHRLENLRLLCPNCHSQTPTFAGRARRLNLERDRVGRERERKPRPRKVDYGRVVEEYARVRNYTAVARQFGVSGSAIRKIVKRSGIVQQQDAAL